MAKKKVVKQTKKKRVKKPVKKAVRKPAKRKPAKKTAAKIAVKKLTPKEERILIGKIDHYFDELGVAAMTLENELALGDIVQIEGGLEPLAFEQEIISMQIEHEPVQIAKKGAEVGFKVGKKVREGYRVYKKRKHKK